MLGKPLPLQIPVSSTRPVVIGVVTDAITARLHERSAFAGYEPLGPASESFARLMIRVAPGTTGVIDQARILFGVSPQDPIAFAGAAAILLGAATLAVLVPTRRAAAVDPAFVLRQS